MSTGARAAQVRAALEDDLTWRRDEIRNLRNLSTSGSGKSGDACRRRALLLLLYAHLEGFIRFALVQYATTINDCRIAVSDAKQTLSAATLSERFKRHRSSDVGDPFDPSGNRARQVERDAALITDILALQGTPVSLPINLVTSADSNLTPTVLRRNLVSLGLEDSEFIKYSHRLEGLLSLRNRIAHGENANLPSDPNYWNFETKIFDLCEEVMRTIYESVRDEKYRA
ncbi:MAE_28990/MAE_18760 family HEPN-like nuclease [Tsukamurella soli]